MEGITTRVETVREEFLTLGLWMGVVTVPLLFGGPQLLVGSIVNALLFVASRRLDQRQLAVMAVLPSLAAVGHGILFGGLTGYLIKLLPFIWVGNFLLMIIFRKVSNRWGGVVIASVLKAGWLWGATYLLSVFGVVPKAMVVLMGVAQLTTAMIGGMGVNLIMKRR